MENVIANIQLRSEESKRNVDSKIKTGLIIQGGGMRGIYSMACLLALEKGGLGGAFDHVYGASAGAVNGAYFLSKQSALCLRLYLEDLCSNAFINYFRISKVMDVDYLVDKVFKKKKILNIEKLIASRSILHIILTDYLTSRSVEVTNKDKDFDLFESFRATTAIPILYNKVVYLKDRAFIDGAASDSLPVYRAIESGCTDILVLLTRSPSFRREPSNLFVELIKKIYLRKYPDVMKNALLVEDENYNTAMAVIEDSRIVPAGVRILAVYASDPGRMVGRATRNTDHLISCAHMGFNDTCRFLGLEPLQNSDDFRKLIRSGA